MPDGEQIRLESEATDRHRLLEHYAGILTDLVRAHPLLSESVHRLLRLQLVEPGEKAGEDEAARGFVGEMYDYTNDRVLRVSGALDVLESGEADRLQVELVAYQPPPTDDELRKVAEIVQADEELGRLVRTQEWNLYHPMPAIAEGELFDGRSERILTVGLADPDNVTRRIVGVRLRDRAVLQDLPGLPRLGDRACEPAPSGDGCSSTGNSGQAWINVWYGGVRVWRFLVVRPAESSGTNGSGVELRYVDFRGHRLLYRAHVPILNIEYFSEGQAAGCGPTYRDWLNQESCFDAPLGADVTPGVRICSGPARTIIESGQDTGNFRGAAIYVDGLEVVIVSELAAGWYRYISEWRLHVNGTIRPRFGFAAVANPCTCLGHHHHVYWRLDLDVDGAAPNRVEEYNNPPLIPGTNWHTKAYEVRRPRDPGRNRRWRISNPLTRASYLLVPGGQDGTASPYGVGDLWVLRYHGNELDDGQGFTTDPALSAARLDPFLTPAEPVSDQDVVLWYSAHFVHDEAHGHPGGHYVGPQLSPERWPA